MSYLTEEGENQEKMKTELEQKEILQQKHYFLLNELQNMARELPQKYQQRLPYELLSSLAHALLDGTVFQIVQDLKEIQYITERQLFERRMKTININKTLRQELLKKHKEALTTQGQINLPNIATIQAKQEKEIEELDKWQDEDETKTNMKIILELDQTVSDQQVTLEKAGVPGFFVTNNPNEIRLQMYLLEFIIRIGSSEGFMSNT